MLEFYYNFLDYYLDRRDFKLLQMDTDSNYTAWSGENFIDLVKPELREEYHNGRQAKFLSTSKYHDRTPGLFRQVFQGTMMIALTCKSYYAEDDMSRAKFSCKGVTKKQNHMSWERYLEALNGSINKARNTGFRLLGSGIVNYTQSKLGLSAYYNK